MVMVQLRLFPGPSDDPTMGLAGFAEVTSSLRGCLACRLYRAAAGAPELLYLEMWEDWPSLEAHVGSSNFRRLLKFMELSAQPPELMFSEAADCRGLEFVERIRGARPGCGGHTRSPEGDTL